MTPREIAVWLNSDCTDEEFVETFALLYQGMYGRGIPTEYDRETLIERMDTRYLCSRLEQILNEIKGR